jgi:hypothetical protein
MLTAFCSLGWEDEEAVGGYDIDPGVLHLLTANIRYFVWGKSMS